jgi:hypothetical protein
LGLGLGGFWWGLWGGGGGGGVVLVVTVVLVLVIVAEYDVIDNSNGCSRMLSNILTEYCLTNSAYYEINSFRNVTSAVEIIYVIELEEVLQRILITYNLLLASIYF